MFSHLQLSKKSCLISILKALSFFILFAFLVGKLANANNSASLDLTKDKILTSNNKLPGQLSRELPKELPSKLPRELSSVNLAKPNLAKSGAEKPNPSSPPSAIKADIPLSGSAGSDVAEKSQDKVDYIESCEIADNSLLSLAQEISQNLAKINELEPCIRVNRQLMHQLVSGNYNVFSMIHPQLQQDQIFVQGLLHFNSKILPLVPNKLRNDRDFMSFAVTLDPDALSYCGSNLCSQFSFMEEMIILNPKNYRFGTKNLQENRYLAELAISANPNLILEAPPSIKNNINIVKIALESNPDIALSLDDKIKQNPEIARILSDFRSLKTSGIKAKNIAIINKNYLGKNQIKVGNYKPLTTYSIINQATLFPEAKIINRPFINKWQKESAKSSLSLKILKDRHNYGKWQKELQEKGKENQSLAKDITTLLKQKSMTKKDIDQLKLTQLWQFKINKDHVVALNLYNFEPESQMASDYGFASINDITIIAKLTNNHWQISLVDEQINRRSKLDIGFLNGHRHPIIWDLLSYDEEKKDIKILFKIEDRYSQYFEIYSGIYSDNKERFIKIDGFQPNL